MSSSLPSRVTLGLCANMGEVLLLKAVNPLLSHFYCVVVSVAEGVVTIGHFILVI